MANDPSGTRNASSDNKVTDPVCGMRIAPSTAVGSSEYKGQRYFFCSASCKTSFDGDPAKYGAQGGGGGRA